jgi:hypothetical protein
LLEEITALKCLVNKLALFLCFIPFFTVYPKPINIAGLLNLTQTTIPNGYNFFIVDNLQNKHFRLVLFKEKGYAVIKQNDLGFEKPVVYLFNYSISKAVKLFEFNNESIFAAVARKERTVLIFSLSQDGIIKIKDVNKYFTYPSEISFFYNDILNNFYLLISGNNFSGLATLKLNKEGRIIEKNYFKTNPYKSAFLMDLNWDFIPDIVAFNSFFNKIDLYYSYDGKAYLKEREINFNSKCENIFNYDFNKDNYSDLIVSSESGFEILLGDSVYSFNSKNNINIYKKPERFFVTELNNNKFPEIVFSEKNSGKLNVLFDIDLSRVENQLVELSAENVVYSEVRNNGNVGKLFYLDNKNNLFCIEKVNDINEKTNLSLPSIFGTIGGDLSLNVLYYIDNNNLTLNILTSNKGKFDKYYSRKIADKYDKIKMFAKGEYNYFLMTNGESNNFGLVILNKKSEILSFKQYFLKSPIHDFLINTSNNELIIILKNKGIIELQRYELTDEGIKTIDELNIDNKVFDAKLNSFYTDHIIYWKYDNERNSLVLQKLNITNEEKNKITAINVKNPKSIKVNSIFMRYDKNPVYAAIVYADSLFYFITYNYKNGKVSVFEPKNENENIFTNLSIENKLVWYNNFLFINNSKKGFFVKLDISKLGKFINEKIEVPFTENYFVAIINKKIYLAYTTNNSIIKFKEIGDTW